MLFLFLDYILPSMELEIKTQPQRFDWLGGVCVFLFHFFPCLVKKSSQIVLIYEIKQTNFRHKFVA